MLKFLRIPFGQSGDRATVPDAVVPTGEVSYTEGYGTDYARPKTDPLSKNIEREKMNQLFFDATTAVRELQSQGVPDFITTVLNGGAPFPYAQNAMVRWTDNKLYLSLVAANTSLPTDATKWVAISDSYAYKSLVNVAWMVGADPTGVADSTAAFVAAAALGGGRIYVGPGTWAINWVVTSKIIIEGAGSNSTFIKPFNTATAAITYRSSSPFWTYHSEVRNLCFLGTAKVGVGFTFGRTDPNTYVTGDEYFNNVKFYGVRFQGLRKGVQFPAGNIGSDFYSCNWTANYYGVYGLNNKFGGDQMHAGNKYFYAGEFNSNDCAVYMHNTADGLYGFAFNGTIFEQNKIAGYFYSTSTFVPASFTATGAEVNGTLLGGSTSLDQWAGSVNTPALFTNRSWIFDGTWCDAVFDKSGLVTDINLIAEGTEIAVENSRVERAAGFGGAENTIVSNTSRIAMRQVVSAGGPPVATRCVADGRIRFISTSASDAGRRWVRVPNRATKMTAYGGEGLRQTFTGASGTVNTTLGGFTMASVSVVDGDLYANCSEYTIPAGTAGQFTIVPFTGSLAGVIGKWVVASVRVKSISGAVPRLLVGDLGPNQVFDAVGSAPEAGVWTTIVGICAMQAATGIGMQIGGDTVTGVFRLSAAQIRGFATRREAEDFMNSGVFVEN